MENITIYPKCHPYWVINNKKVLNPRIQGVSYTADGYILPCCWCDKPEANDFYKLGLYDEDLKLDNVDDIQEEIICSPEWYNFHTILLTEPQNAPNICKKKCDNYNDNVVYDKKNKK